MDITVLKLHGYQSATAILGRRDYMGPASCNIYICPRAKPSLTRIPKFNSSPACQHNHPLPPSSSKRRTQKGREKTKSGINFGGGVSEVKMCYGGERLPSKEDFDVNSPTRPSTTTVARLVAVNENEAVVENLRDRLAETEARLERARAREAELSRQLEEMKRFVSVMEILETYLKRRYREQQDQLCRLFSPVSAKSL